MIASRGRGGVETGGAAASCRRLVGSIDRRRGEGRPALLTRSRRSSCSQRAGALTAPYRLAGAASGTQSAMLEREQYEGLDFALRSHRCTCDRDPSPDSRRCAVPGARPTSTSPGRTQCRTRAVAGHSWSPGRGVGCSSDRTSQISQAPHGWTGLRRQPWDPLSGATRDIGGNLRGRRWATRPRSSTIHQPPDLRDPAERDAQISEYLNGGVAGGSARLVIV